MNRYKLKIKTGLLAEAEDYTTYASSARVAINKTLERYWKTIAFKDFSPGEGMLFSIDIENEGTVFLTGRITWKREEQRGVAGFTTWATEKGWRTPQETPDGHALLNKKNNQGHSFWRSREDLQHASPYAVQMLEEKLEREEALT